MEIELTKSAAASLKKINDAYKAKIKDGVPPKAAVRFVNGRDSDLISSVRSDLEELKNAGFVRCFILGDFDFTEKGVAYMENAFKRKANEVLSIFSNVKP